MDEVEDGMQSGSKICFNLLNGLNKTGFSSSKSELLNIRIAF